MGGLPPGKTGPRRHGAGLKWSRASLKTDRFAHVVNRRSDVSPVQLDGYETPYAASLAGECRVRAPTQASVRSLRFPNEQRPLPGRT